MQICHHIYFVTSIYPKRSEQFLYLWTQENKMKLFYSVFYFYFPLVQNTFQKDGLCKNSRLGLGLLYALWGVTRLYEHAMDYSEIFF